jgi:hypothetical protein
MIDFSAPLQGMAQAEDRVNTAAVRIANAPAQAPGDSVDLSTEAVALLQGKNDFAANVKVAQTENEMAKSLMNILA